MHPLASLMVSSSAGTYSNPAANQGLKRTNEFLQVNQPPSHLAKFNHITPMNGSPSRGPFLDCPSRPHNSWYLHVLQGITPGKHSTTICLQTPLLFARTCSSLICTHTTLRRGHHPGISTGMAWPCWPDEQRPHAEASFVWGAPCNTPSPWSTQAVA